MNTYLEVDYAEKEQAKAGKAKWCAMRKKWYVKGSRIPECLKQFAIVDLCVPYELKDEAKAAGAKWDMIRKTWYCSKKKSDTVLKRFVEGYVSDQDDADESEENEQKL